MTLNIETPSLISAVQAAVLAAMLWLGTYGNAGKAFTSLRIRAAALALEAAGWGMLAGHLYFSPAMLLLGGNALNLIAQGLAVLALRMLLNEPLRWRLVLAVGVLGWLGVAWFGLIDIDYRTRVLWGSVAITINMLLNIEALRSGSRQRKGSRARNVLLLICVMAILLLIWRNSQLWLGADQPDTINVPGATNFFYVMFSGLQPLFASIGFLLLYNEILQQELHALARIDTLTGINNRLAVSEEAARLLVQAVDRGQSLGVLMVDVDHFKSVNDRFGHSGGDFVLQALVANIRNTLRQNDVIGRVGGEEFLVLSPGITLQGALALGERVRLMVESRPLMIEGHTQLLTVSVGVAVAAPAECDVGALLQRADKALYAAKRAGRNQVKAEGSCEDQSRHTVESVVVPGYKVESK